MFVHHLSIHMQYTRSFRTRIAVVRFITIFSIIPARYSNPTQIFGLKNQRWRSMGQYFQYTLCRANIIKISNNGNTKSIKRYVNFFTLLVFFFHLPLFSFIVIRSHEYPDMNYHRFHSIAKSQKSATKHRSGWEQKSGSLKREIRAKISHQLSITRSVFLCQQNIQLHRKSIYFVRWQCVLFARLLLIGEHSFAICMALKCRWTHQEPLKIVYPFRCSPFCHSPFVIRFFS